MRKIYSSLAFCLLLIVSTTLAQTQCNVSISTNASTICIGNMVTISASGADSYSWSNGATTNSITVNPSNTTTYKVIGTGNSCTSDTAETTIIVNLFPNLTVTSTTICSGTSGRLDAAGTDSYVWTGGGTLSGAGNQTMTDSPTKTTSYTVTGTTNGCSSTAVGSITVMPVPVVRVNSVTICEGQTANLTAAGATSYAWSDGSFGNPLTVTPIATTSYTVTGVGGTCSSAAVGKITVVRRPTLTVNSSTICKGDMATLVASGGAEYIWSNGSTTASITVSPSVTTTYTVSDNSQGCAGRTVSKVTVAAEPVPILDGSEDQTICINNPISDILYDVAFSYTVLGLPTGVAYQFDQSVNRLKISGTPSVDGVFTYTLVPNSSTCNLSSKITGTITVKPLSTSTTNQGNCDGFINISGNVYHDKNNNCTKDTGDQAIDNIHLKLYNAKNQLLAHNYTSAGAYNFSIWDSVGTYIVELDVEDKSFSTQCVSPGLTRTVTLTNPTPQANNVNFSLKCDSDYGIQSISTRGRVFPGQQHQLNILAGDVNYWNNMNCPLVGSGTLKVSISGPVTYAGVAFGALTPTVQGNVYTYDINDWKAVNINYDFGLLFNTATSAQANDSICVNVVLTTSSNEINTDNNTYNFCYRVRNSYDPNLKEVYPVDVEPGFKDWLTYTIHFQNTGNDSAINIKLKDTLDSKLNLETFQVIGYSHKNIITIHDKLLTVFYPNIQLPDSATNPLGSQGHIQYRIKPKANLPLGTQIKNTVNIYFDYNPPITTNTTVNEYKNKTTAISENKQLLMFNIYPNPNNGSFTISSTGAGAYYIINTLGQPIQLFQLNSSNNYSAVINNLAAGVYFIGGEHGTVITKQKIIVTE